MIGSRIGSRAGFIGSAVGSSADDEGTVAASMATVTKDATSNIYCPATAAEWASTLAVAGIVSGGPYSLWNLQDNANPATDAIGTAPMSNAGTSPVFNSAFAGWNRRSVATTDGTIHQLSSTDASIPNTVTTSHLVLCYVAVTNAAPAANRDIFLANGSGTSTRALVQATTGLPQLQLNGQTAAGASAFPATAIPVVVRINATGSTQVMFTLANKITPTWVAPPANQLIGLGGLVESAPSANFLYMVAFKGAAAEMTDAKLKTLLQTLGWTVTWT